ncbi:MAG TPA: hypothetical protein VE377_05905 [Candidatus Dormibacteraeota bacterium]|nr:hypothetical protein [Candidatus Dormibacteraeota bacterium]
MPARCGTGTAGSSYHRLSQAVYTVLTNLYTIEENSPLGRI